MNVAVFASGAGTTLQAILDAFTDASPGAFPDTSADRAGAREASANLRPRDVRIALVVSNNPGAVALERARRAGIPTLVADHRGRSRETFEEELAAAVDAHAIDLICLAGFLRILSPGFVARYPGRILNTHPALLPAFGGKGMYGERVHHAVLAAGVPISGCTIHFVDEVPDGGPIVAQAVVPVLDGDTPSSLAERVQAEERRLYPQVINWLVERRVEIRGRDVILHAAGQASRDPADLRPTNRMSHPAGARACRP